MTSNESKSLHYFMCHTPVSYFNFKCLNKTANTKVGLNIPYKMLAIILPSQLSLMKGTNSINHTHKWKGGLFWGYKNLICFSHSRDGSPSATPVPTPIPACTFQFARLAPLLYLWHVPETHDGTATPSTTRAQPPLLTFFLLRPLPVSPILLS